MAIDTHPKFLERGAKIFLLKHRKEGAESAKEWMRKTYTEEQIKKIIPIIHNGGNIKK